MDENKIAFYKKYSYECLERELGNPGFLNSVLLYGEQKDTLKVMQDVYKKASNRGDILCSWHESSEIKKPMDFFEPILKLKYRERYNEMKKEKFFIEIVEENDLSCLAEMCQKGKGYKGDSNKDKLPIFFINGIEELFFNMDYGHLDRKELERRINTFDESLPFCQKFSSSLREQLHQTGKGVFYGIIKSTDSLDYRCTMAEYHYLFYADNFKPVRLMD